MAADRKNKREDIYIDEATHLSRAKKFLEIKNPSAVDIKEELSTLTSNYSELLDQVKLITRISDRLQRKLDHTNDTLNEKNQEIQEKNSQLEKTVADLAEAKIGRKATTFVFVFAILLFIVSEAFVDPLIEGYYNDFYISLGIKGIIALSIKPVESLLERTLLKKARVKTLESAGTV